MEWLCKFAVPHLWEPCNCAEFLLLADSTPGTGMEYLKNASGGVGGVGAAYQAQVALLPCNLSPLRSRCR